MSADLAPKPWYVKHIWILAAIVGVLSLTIMRTCGGRKLVPLASLGQVPAFTLQDQTGATFDSKSLEGRVWVASFFFTSCKTVCPAIGRANQALAKKLSVLGDLDVRLVSFTVDPEFDTPAAMTTWGAQFDADPKRWHLLTGPRPAITAVVQGFASEMGQRETKDGIVDISHSMRLVLVAPNGNILHHFRDEPEQLDLIVDYARYLDAEHKKSQQVAP